MKISIFSRKKRHQGGFSWALQQTGFILLISVLIGLTVNFLRQDSLILFPRSLAKDAMTKGAAWPKEASFEDVAKLYPYLKMHFFDTRPLELYEQAHIPGARHIPHQLTASSLRAATIGLTRDALMVLYGEGDDAAQYSEIMHSLTSMGYGNVYLIRNGWNLWTSNELPIEAGLPIQR